METIFYRYDHGLKIAAIKSLKDDYREMKDMGGDAVAFSVTLEDINFVPREILRNIGMMKDAGLRSIMVFGRWGGLFSAAYLNSGSRHTFSHPELWKVRKDGQRQTVCLVCCVNNPAFREFFFQEAEKSFSRYQPDGILMDEPKDSDVPCYCPYCKKIGDPEKIHIPTLSAFLGDVCALFKKMNPSGKTYMFHMPRQAMEFYEKTAALKDLDFLGVDGPVCRQVKASGRDVGKIPLLDSIKVIYPVAEKYGKRKLVVPENFYVPSGEEESYYRNACELLKTRPDAVIFHHYGFENENPELIMKHVRKLIAQFKHAPSCHCCPAE